MNALSRSDREFIFNALTALVAAIVRPDPASYSDAQLEEMRKREKSLTYVPRSDDDIISDLKIRHARLIVAKAFDDQ